MSINFPLLLVIAVAVCGFLALIDLILLAGMHVQSTARALAASGWPGDRLAHEPDIDDTAMSHIASMLLSGDMVLLKGSRGIALERVLECRRSMETEESRS